MPFRILDGLKIVDVTPEAWNAWHADLNEKQDNHTRVMDSHTLALKDTRVRITTMFVGGPGEPWLTFVTGWPGITEYSECLGEARQKHHSLLHSMLDMGWKMNPDYHPNSYLRRK